MDKKALINSRILKFPKNNRTDKIFLEQPKIKLPWSFKSTPDSVKQLLKAFERNPGSWVPLSNVELNFPPWIFCFDFGFLDFELSPLQS